MLHEKQVWEEQRVRLKTFLLFQCAQLAGSLAVTQSSLMFTKVKSISPSRNKPPVCMETSMPYIKSKHQLLNFD